MGRVELALRRESGFARAYAVKRLRSDDDPKTRALFLREARLAGLVRHPNVVPVLDFGQDAAGPYLVMDFVLGISLARMLDLGRALPVQIAVRIAKEIAAGLHAAHELRDEGRWLALVHCDVSPQNVLVGLDGVARLTDFGIARSELTSGETTGYLLRGKVGYLAPEQLRFAQPTRRTDLYALGVVLWEMLSGEPFAPRDDAARAARAILDEPARSLRALRPEIPEALDTLVAELLEKDPAWRPATARDVERRLDSVLCELVLYEGPSFVVDHIERALASEAEAVRRVLAQAWDEFSRISSDQQLLTMEFDALEPIEETPVLSQPVRASHTSGESRRAFRRPPPPPPRRSRRRWQVAMAAAGLVAVGALFASAAGREAAPETEPSEIVPAAAVIEDVVGEAPAPEEQWPAVQATDLAVQAFDPAVQATDLAVQAFDPAVQATDLAVQATDLAVQATDPAVQATDPAVQATDPAVQAPDLAVQAPDLALQAPDLAAQSPDPALQSQDSLESSRRAATRRARRRARARAAARASRGSAELWEW